MPDYPVDASYAGVAYLMRKDRAEMAQFDYTGYLARQASRSIRHESMQDWDCEMFPEGFVVSEEEHERRFQKHAEVREAEAKPLRRVVTPEQQQEAIEALARRRAERAEKEAQRRHNIIHSRVANEQAREARRRKREEAERERLAAVRRLRARALEVMERDDPKMNTPQRADMVIVSYTSNEGALTPVIEERAS